MLLTASSGGAVLSALLEEGIQKKHPISVLVRGEEKAAIFQSKGVNTVLFDDLDDLATLQRSASEHDSMSITAHKLRENLLIETSRHPYRVGIPLALCQSVDPRVG